MSRRLTLRQDRFVKAYLNEARGNAGLAAQLAGYDNKNPSAAGWQILRKANVRAAIEAARPKIERVTTGLEQLIWDTHDRQAWWTHIAQSDEIDVKDRLKASELLARAQGDFVEHRVVDDRREVAKLSDDELYAKVRAKVFEREGIQAPWNSN